MIAEADDAERKTCDLIKKAIWEVITELLQLFEQTKTRRKRNEPTSKA